MTFGPSGLLDVERFILPKHVLAPTLKFLRARGRHRVEGVVAWGGSRESIDVFRFEVAYVPRQTAIRSPDGLMWHVDERALDEMNRSFNEAGLTLAAQAHSHPTDAFHSDTDDRLPIVTLLGSLSLVVPNFAKKAVRRTTSFEWFRLHGYMDWRSVDPADAVELT